MTQAEAGAPAAPSAPQAGAAPGAQGAPAGTPPAAPPQDALSIGNAPAPKPEAPISVTYEKTGDAGLDMALKFLGGLGIGPEDPAMAASMNGDFGPLEAMLRTMGDKSKGWEDYVALGKKSFGEAKTKADEAKAKTEQAIHTVVGGKETWEKIQSWASQNAEPHEKEAVNKALSMGPLVAKAMALHLQGLFNKAAGTVVDPTPAVGSGASARPDTAGPLSAKEYSAAVRALHAKLGGKMEGSPEYRSLNARRDAARRAGK